jgi:hypothetical protein
MGKPLTIQIEDDQRLASLKKTLGVPTKIEVLRRALDTLEEKLNRQKKLKQWKRAVQVVSKQSTEVNQEFQKHSLLHNS